MPQVSVIIPIYNVEKYIDRCVLSVLGQTYTDFECILVDDGSPDNCPMMCDDYEKKDERIRVIHKQNGGLSDARNAGIEIARGEYIFFVDSDDWIHPKTLEVLFDTAKKTNAGYVGCKMLTTSKFNDYNKIDIENISVNVYSKEEIFNNCNGRYYWEIGPYACGKLYKKECFDKLRFNTEMKLYEDEYSVLDLIDAAGTVALVDEKLYYYYQSENSLMRDKMSVRFLFTFKSLQHLSDFMRDKGIYSEMNIFEFKWMMAYFDMYYRIKKEAPEFMPEFEKYKPEFIKKQKDLFKNPNVTRAYKIMLILFRINPNLAYRLYKKLSQ